MSQSKRISPRCERRYWNGPTRPRDSRRVPSSMLRPIHMASVFRNVAEQSALCPFPIALGSLQRNIESGGRLPAQKRSDLRIVKLHHFTHRLDKVVVQTPSLIANPRCQDRSPARHSSQYRSKTGRSFQIAACQYHRPYGKKGITFLKLRY